MGQALSSNVNYLELLGLFVGMMFSTYLYHFLNQQSADSKIAAVKRECTESMANLQDQVTQAAENTKKLRDSDKNEYEATLQMMVKKYNSKLNALESEISLLTKECETLRIGRIAFQRDISESNQTIEVLRGEICVSKQTIENLRGEIGMNSNKYSGIIDSLQQEVEALRKQLKEQRRKHDIEMEALQSVCDELNDKLSRKHRSSLGALVSVRHSALDEDENIVLKHLLANKILHEQSVENVKEDAVVKKQAE